MLKRFILILTVILTGLPLWAQFTEDFSDGNFTADPMWQGDLHSFIVNHNNELQLYIDGSAETYIATTSQVAADAVWEFYCRIACNTSAYNLCRIYLISENEDPIDSNGWYVQVGGANKNVTLRRQTGSENKVLIENDTRRKIFDRMEDIRVRVRVERDNYGYLSLFTMIDGIDGSWFEDGSVHVQSMHGSWFCLWIKNSSQNGRAFYFDDINVSGSPDNDDTPAEPHVRSSEAVFLERASFSPNGDRYEDECNIGYNMPSHGYLASLTVFTPSGVQVAKVFQEEELSLSGILTWDGTDGHGAKLESGVYVLLFEAWNNDVGGKISRKLVVALTM